MFKQLQSLVPDLYSYGVQASKLWIDFKTCSDVQKRVCKLREMLESKTIETFVQHCQAKKIENPDQYVQAKQWHHSFDPHTAVEPLHEAELSLPQIKSESLHSFLES